MKNKEYKTLVTDDYVFFLRGPLGNWYPCKLQYSFNGKVYHFFSSEQMFMWLKAMLFSDFEIADKILNCKTSRESKDLGREVRGFNGKMWDKWKYVIMLTCIETKFRYCNEFRDELFKYDGRHFVEANPVDVIWACGLSMSNEKILNKENWYGENLLGQVMDEVYNNHKPKQLSIYNSIEPENFLEKFENKLVYIKLDSKERWSLNGVYIGVLKKDSNPSIGYVISHPMCVDSEIVAGESNFDENGVVHISELNQKHPYTLEWALKYNVFHNSVMREKGYDSCELDLTEIFNNSIY